MALNQWQTEVTNLLRDGEKRLMIHGGPRIGKTWFAAYLQEHIAFNAKHLNSLDEFERHPNATIYVADLDVELQSIAPDLDNLCAQYPSARICVLSSERPVNNMGFEHYIVGPDLILERLHI